MAKLSTKIGKRNYQSQMARFMARNSRWPENIFHGQGGSNMARLDKCGHQMARLTTLLWKEKYINILVNLPAQRENRVSSANESWVRLV